METKKIEITKYLVQASQRSQIYFIFVFHFRLTS